MIEKKVTVQMIVNENGNMPILLRKNCNNKIGMYFIKVEYEPICGTDSDDIIRYEDQYARS